MKLLGRFIVGVTGIVVSTTFTILMICVAGFPELSETLYVTLYTHTIAVFTEFTVTILEVRVPSSISLAVAPASV